MTTHTSTDYAIRALIALALADVDRFIITRELAAQERIPPYFLAKILQDLAHRGILASRKGPTGGFRLALPADRITLARLVQEIEGETAWEGLLIGPIAEAEILRYQDTTTIADLARAAVAIRARKRKGAA